MSTMNEAEIYDAIVAIMNENGRIKLRTFQTMDSSGLVIKIKALIAQQVREARIEELTGLLSMQNNKPRRVLLKDAVNIAYRRVCELSDVKSYTRRQPND